MKKKFEWSSIASILIMFIFLASLGVGFVAPIFRQDPASQQQKSQEEQQKKIQELIDQQQKAQAEYESQKTYDPNFKTEGDITEMKIVDLVTGSGAEAKLGSTIKAKYKGALAADGSIFDQNDEGVEFKLAEGSLIKGWIEGIPGMKVGGKRRLIIPSEKGYGPQGSPPEIPANADLVFEVELLEVK